MHVVCLIVITLLPARDIAREVTSRSALDVPALQSLFFDDAKVDKTHLTSAEKKD
jgi:hypothetical protein